ncbi:hypothetical protein BDDG_13460 [Blastomyces dermatitidis ATCC 18188]|uniref:Uncharacterized protein n=1 Tax=Ajellomyces dermatitidis (strain ATCC 18188 / CBS 674.68) TaxID=653446 RepID=A0A0J9ETD8_AJEDA|nr:hypothetical protein BDDG_13460 [Blastomyces dermatitidis ATCC 18188]
MSCEETRQLEPEKRKAVVTSCAGTGYIFPPSWSPTSHHWGGGGFCSKLQHPAWPLPGLDWP